MVEPRCCCRVGDRLPQVLVLIIENQHQCALLRHVSSEQFHRRLQVVVGICTKSDLCASYLAFAVGIRNLDNYLDLHTGAEWDLRRAKRAAGMCAALAKDFQKKFGGAIGHLVRFGKDGSAVHQYQQPDDTFHPIQVVQGTVQRREEFDGDITRCLPSAVVISCPTLPENGLPSFFASRPDK
jgi:hypothetical protein